MIRTKMALIVKTYRKTGVCRPLDAFAGFLRDTGLVLIGGSPGLREGPAPSRFQVPTVEPSFRYPWALSNFNGVSVGGSVSLDEALMKSLETVTISAAKLIETLRLPRHLIR
jgi:hypothetical protein